MSNDTHGAHEIKASKGGGAGKWIAGAAVAALLAGGGYAAYKYYGAPQGTTASTEMAYNLPNSEPQHAGPLPPSEESTTSQSAPDEASTGPSASVQTASNTPTSHRRQAVQEAVPETVVGITPVSDTVTTKDEGIIVRGRRPVWTHTPTTWRLSTLYPERALESGREGEASVHCMVRNSGALNCVPVSEYPAHAGFGDAAMRVARMFRHAPQLADGSTAAGTPINLRVVFRLADDERRG